MGQAWVRLRARLSGCKPLPNGENMHMNGSERRMGASDLRVMAQQYKPDLIRKAAQEWFTHMCYIDTTLSPICMYVFIK